MGALGGFPNPPAMGSDVQSRLCPTRSQAPGPGPAGYDCRSVSLRAPIAVPVEIRAPARRLYRLAAAVGEDGIRLARGASFEPGRPVDVRFALPDGGGAFALPAVVAEGDAPDDELAFVDPPADAREAIRGYVHGRLGLRGISI